MSSLVFIFTREPADCSSVQALTGDEEHKTDVPVYSL